MVYMQKFQRKKIEIKKLIASLVAVCCLFGSTNQLNANPFAINFPEKENLSNEDYINIQQQLQAINIEPLLKKLYSSNKGYDSYEDFYGRCARGITQILIDPSKGLYPSRYLEKIGQGSDMCIVCCVPYDNIRSSLVKYIAPALQKTDFNGYFLYQIGGFPNPTGKEIKYVGVPYSFKIFMMLEAAKLGFNKVLWLDSAALPLRDITPLFERIEDHEIMLHGWKTPSDSWTHLFPPTRKLLKNITGVDVLDATYVCTIAFGLKMNAPRVKNLISDYYYCCELGTPFLTCFPEEFVLTAIIGKPEYSSWKPHRFPNLLGGTDGHEEDTAATIELRKKQGYFFYHLKRNGREGSSISDWLSNRK
jgi:hypothetical protein